MDEATIVVDVGSAVMKIGFCGEDAPRAVFPSIVGRLKEQFQQVPGQCAHRNPVVGDGAFAPLLRPSYPIERGVVTNWDDMERIWRHVFYLNGNVDPSEHTVLWTEAPLMPRANRERMTQLMFETLEVKAICVASQGVMSLYHSGWTSGIVLTSGHSLSHTVPVYEGYPIHHGILSSCLGGHHVTEYLQRLLRESGYVFTTSKELEIVRNVKEKLAYVALDFDEEMKSDIDSKSYELPDGNIVPVVCERFRCTEVLFKPFLNGLPCQGIHEMIFQSIQACPIDVRQDLLRVICLSGATIMFPGMVQRFSKELEDLTGLRCGTGLRTFKIHAPPDRCFSAWIGASVYAWACQSAGTFQQICMSRHQYEEEGCQGVHRRCGLGFQDNEAAVCSQRHARQQQQQKLQSREQKRFELQLERWPVQLQPPLPPRPQPKPQTLVTPALANATPDLRDFLLEDEMEELPDVQSHPMSDRFLSEAHGIFEELRLQGISQPLEPQQSTFIAYQEVHYRGYHLHLIPPDVQERLSEKLLVKIAELWQVHVDCIQSCCGKFKSLTLQSGTVTEKCYLHGTFKLPDAQILEQELEVIFTEELEENHQARDLSEEPGMDSEKTNIGIVQCNGDAVGKFNLQYFKVHGWQGVKTYLQTADAGTPSWVLVKNGLNLIFDCKNECSVLLHTKQFGFQEFFQVKDHLNQLCEKCGNKLSLRKTEYLYFKSTEWKVLDKCEDDARIEWEDTGSAALVAMSAPSEQDKEQMCYANPVVCTRPRPGLHHSPKMPCFYKVVCRTGVVLYAHCDKESQSNSGYDMGDKFQVTKVREDPEIHGLLWAKINKVEPNWMIIEEDGKKLAKPS